MQGKITLIIRYSLLFSDYCFSFLESGFFQTALNGQIALDSSDWTGTVWTLNIIGWYKSRRGVLRFLQTNIIQSSGSFVFLKLPLAPGSGKGGGGEGGVCNKLVSRIMMESLWKNGHLRLVSWFWRDLIGQDLSEHYLFIVKAMWSVHPFSPNQHHRLSRIRCLSETTSDGWMEGGERNKNIHKLSWGGEGKIQAPPL